MTVSSDTYRGAWRVLPILGANTAGTIHDDDEASRHGFRRAILAALAPTDQTLVGLDAQQQAVAFRKGAL